MVYLLLTRYQYQLYSTPVDGSFLHFKIFQNKGRKGSVENYWPSENQFLRRLEHELFTGELVERFLSKSFSYFSDIPIEHVNERFLELSMY